MLHQIKKDKIGPQAEPMAKAVETCVHCGFCLPTCPTYATMGEEMDSPRGRIFLMKEVLEGKMKPEEIESYTDNCLGCLACVTSCPSGVEYGELISPYRAWAEPDRERSISSQIQRTILLNTLPYPNRFRTAAKIGRYVKPLTKLMPSFMKPMMDMTPASLPPQESLNEYYPAKSKRKGRVALVAGCAQQVLAPRINRAAINVLTRSGIDVLVPKDQGCCGALAMHIGASDEAKKSAQRNFSAFPKDVDAIISTAAGCGSGMKEYGLLFHGSEEQEEAESFADKVIDISVFLEDIGFEPSENCLGANKRVAYHDACHLAHAQGVRNPPRNLLKAIPNLTLLEPAEWELCCGSAGTYNIEHPDTAEELGKRKTANLLATEPDAIAMGNIGCMAQIERHLRDGKSDIPIYHTIELLDDVDS